jgi:hypothetical protein
MSQYFSFRGKVYIAERDSSGNPLGFTYAGNVPTLTLKLGVEKDEHVESTSGYDLVDDVDITKKTGDVTLVAEELIKEVVALALNATPQTVAASAGLTDQGVCTDPVAGKSYMLPHLNVSDVVISADGVAVDAGKYTLDGPRGWLTFNDVTGVAGDITADYDAGAVTQFAMHADTLPEVWIRLNGVNKKTMEKCVVDLYRVGMSPSEAMEWINSKRSSMSLPGTVLADTTKEEGGALGQFGRYVEIA